MTANVSSLWPLIVMELSLKALALVDLAKRPDHQVVGRTKWVWVLVIVFIGLLGPVAYLVVGRRQV